MVQDVRKAARTGNMTSGYCYHDGTRWLLVLHCIRDICAPIVVGSQPSRPTESYRQKWLCDAVQPATTTSGNPGLDGIQTLTTKDFLHPPPPPPDMGLVIPIDVICVRGSMFSHSDNEEVRPNLSLVYRRMLSEDAYRAMDQLVRSNNSARSQ